MIGREDIRRIGPRETIAASLVRDFLLAALSHDAIQDVLSEQLLERLSKGDINPDALASALRLLIEEVLDVATAEDLRSVAACLIDEARVATEKGDSK
jgi:hypothetical protein